MTSFHCDGDLRMFSSLVGCHFAAIHLGRDFFCDRRGHFYLCPCGTCPNLYGPGCIEAESCGCTNCSRGCPHEYYYLKSINCGAYYIDCDNDRYVLNFQGGCPTTAPTFNPPSWLTPTAPPNYSVPTLTPSTLNPSVLPSYSVPTCVPTALPSYSVPTLSPSTLIPSVLPSYSVPTHVPTVPTHVPTVPHVTRPPSQNGLGSSPNPLSLESTTSRRPQLLTRSPTLVNASSPRTPAIQSTLSVNYYSGTSHVGTITNTVVPAAAIDTTNTSNTRPELFWFLIIPLGIVFLYIIIRKQKTFRSTQVATPLEYLEPVPGKASSPIYAQIQEDGVTQEIVYEYRNPLYSSEDIHGYSQSDVTYSLATSGIDNDYELSSASRT